jgi:hypothetical protein
LVLAQLQASEAKVKVLEEACAEAEEVILVNDNCLIIISQDSIGQIIPQQMNCFKNSVLSLYVQGRINHKAD